MEGTGRYVWQTKKDETSWKFVDRINWFRNAGYSEKETAEALGIHSVTKLKTMLENAKKNIRADQIREVTYLHEHGLAVKDICNKTGIEESKIRTAIH